MQTQIVPSVFRTVSLDFGGTTPVFLAPPGAVVWIKGFVLGTSSEFAFFSTGMNPFITPPPNPNFPFYGDAYAVQTGEKFEMLLSPQQSLVAVASITLSSTSGVFVTFTASILPLDISQDAIVDEDILPNVIIGPRLNFRKRGA